MEEEEEEEEEEEQQQQQQQQQPRAVELYISLLTKYSLVKTSENLWDCHLHNVSLWNPFSFHEGVQNVLQ